MIESCPLFSINSKVILSGRNPYAPGIEMLPILIGSFVTENDRCYVHL